MEKLSELSKSSQNNELSNNVQKHVDEIPGWIEMLLSMPKNPAAQIERLTEFRKLKAANDEFFLQSQRYTPLYKAFDE